MEFIKNEKIEELLEQGRAGAGPANQAALAEAQILILKRLEKAIIDLESSIGSVDSNTDETTRYMYQLKQNLERYNNISARYTKWLIILTIILTFLTLIMAFPIIKSIAF